MTRDAAHLPGRVRAFARPSTPQLIVTCVVAAFPSAGRTKTRVNVAQFHLHALAPAP
jgi:hypothetical protein